ncbi:MAG: DUF6390 family protein [Actinomycetota bacterium]|nr:DUF6390 family protein [Actinomycetota bacterium]
MSEYVSDPVPGSVLFARYAFPPNLHGYCGPHDSDAFFDYGVAGTDHRRLRELSQQFDGAWPYLELIAAAAGLDDPLERSVVEAYWVGGPLLDQWDSPRHADSMKQRFGSVVGSKFCALTEQALAESVPHHSFAVFCIYPWTRLLSDAPKATQALHVLDRCRIRWGQVLEVHGDSVMVESAPLVWDGRRLDIGSPETETVVRSREGVGMVGDLLPGDWVSLHWEWVCARLTAQQADYLRSYSMRQLRIVNEHDLHSGAATVPAT